MPDRPPASIPMIGRLCGRGGMAGLCRGQVDLFHCFRDVRIVDSDGSHRQKGVRAS
jgi:hypothetical protein